MQETDEKTLAWLADAWWYHPERDDSPPLEQGLRWACLDSPERMNYWSTERVRLGFASQDGYIPDVLWNPPNYPQHRLSVLRFLAALRQCYDDLKRAARMPGWEHVRRDALEQDAKATLHDLAEALRRPRLRLLKPESSVVASGGKKP